MHNADDEVLHAEAQYKLNRVQTESFNVIANPKHGANLSGRTCPLPKRPFKRDSTKQPGEADGCALTRRIHRTHRVDYPLRFRINISMSRNSTPRAGKRTARLMLTLTALDRRHAPAQGKPLHRMGRQAHLIRRPRAPVRPAHVPRHLPCR